MHVDLCKITNFCAGSWRLVWSSGTITLWVNKLPRSVYSKLLTRYYHGWESCPINFRCAPNQERFRPTRNGKACCSVRNTIQWAQFQPAEAAPYPRTLYFEIIILFSYTFICLPGFLFQFGFKPKFCIQFSCPCVFSATKKSKTYLTICFNSTPSNLVGVAGRGV
jgi:hypothetical protein